MLVGDDANQRHTPVQKLFYRCVSMIYRCWLARTPTKDRILVGDDANQRHKDTNDANQRQKLLPKVGVLANLVSSKPTKDKSLKLS